MHVKVFFVRVIPASSKKAISCRNREVFLMILNAVVNNCPLRVECYYMFQIYSKSLNIKKYYNISMDFTAVMHKSPGENIGGTVYFILLLENKSREIFDIKKQRRTFIQHLPYTVQ